MVQTRDALETLLPDADPRVLVHARTVVQFLRLVSDDACASRAGTVGIGLEQARGELERQDRTRALSALADLLRHHLSAIAPPDTFLWWGEPALDHASAWRVLDEFRGDLPWLVRIPDPGEAPLEVAVRVLGCFGELGAPGAEVALWQGRIARFAEGPRAAEKLLRGPVLDPTGMELRQAPTLELGRALAACVTECLLDRGAVREARVWLADRGTLVEGDPRLRQLLSWTLVCLGDYAGAKTAMVGLTPWTGVLPAGLVGLRTHRPEWLPCLAGKAPSRSALAGEVPAALPVRDRLSLGAAVLGVFALDRDGGAVPLLMETAPALREGMRAWLREREGACAVAGECEHTLVVSARMVVVRRDGDRAMRGALGHESSRSMALVPILDEEGELAGWVHLECEHHLLPGPERLAWIAAGWRPEVLSARRGETAVDFPAPIPSHLPLRSDSVQEAKSACTEVFEQLVSELGIKTAQRRWSGFVLESDGPRLIAAGGEASGLSEKPGGRGRALTRALATRGKIAFEEPEGRLALDEKAGSGVVLPLSAGGAVCGLLAIESSRRKDFKESDLERFAQEAERRGLALRIAQFRGWHRARFGFDVWFDALRGDFRTFAAHLLAAARSRSPVVLSGPPGVGKRILSRWVHFEGPSREEPIRVLACSSRSACASLEELLSSASPVTWLLADVDRLELESQEQLMRRLEGEPQNARSGKPGARLVATMRSTLEQSVAAGTMRQDLAQRLDRLQFRLPALRERREDILPLVACLSRRFAEEEGAHPPALEDEALALLWRQSWAGNVRELESFVYKLVLLGRDSRGSEATAIGAAHVADIAGRFSVPLVRRLPSRHPLRSDLLAALRVTRKAGGRLNKTRAALYLGWDPDTLVARMQDAGIGEDVRDEDAWTVRAPETPEETE